MTYHCIFCWCQVHPDGCGFTHKNKECDFEKTVEIRNWWLAGTAVFNTTTLSVVDV